MTQEIPQLRGYHSILEVVERMKPVYDWYMRFKPEVTRLTLVRKDYDLIARWPKAAELCDFIKVGNEIRYRYFKRDEKTYKDFTLAFDKKAPRYERDDLTASERVA